MSAAIEMPQDQEIGAKRGDLVKQAAELVVTDQKSADRAGVLLQMIAALAKQVHEAFDGIVDAAHKAHKLAVEKRREHLDPLTRAEHAIKDRVGAWVLKEERLRREAAAEAARLERKREEDSRIAEAVALEQAGEAAAAEQVLVAPPSTPPPAAMISAPKVAGVSVRDVWHAEVTDLGALVRAIAAGKAPLSFVEAALGTIQKHTAATDGAHVPDGVRAWKAPAISRRGR